MKKITFLAILLLILSGCGTGNARYDFSGSSENWNMTYVVNVSSGDREEKNGTVKFIGDGQAPETIDYKIETNSGGSAGTGITLSEKAGKIGNGFCKGCAVMQWDEEIMVEITWDGQKENLMLTTEE